MSPIYSILQLFITLLYLQAGDTEKGDSEQEWGAVHHQHRYIKVSYDLSLPLSFSLSLLASVMEIVVLLAKHEAQSMLVLEIIVVYMRALFCIVQSS